MQQSIPEASDVAASSDDERLDPAVWRIAAVALFGALLAQLDATIVNVSLSSLATELHSSLATVQWVTSGYLLALTLVLPLNGWLVGRIGSKALYLWCFSAFTLCSTLCGLAWSAGSLIGFRVLQGVSGGLLAPMTQMMIARAAGRHMARVAGYMAVPVLLAPVLGPVLAGSILQYASWRWLFLVNVPVGLIALALVVRFLPDDRDETARRRLDWLGLALLSPGLVMLLYGFERLGATAGSVIMAAGVGMIMTFLCNARHKAGDALIDLRLFGGKAFSTAAITQFLSNGGMFAGQMLIPAFLIQACGRTPGQMGWMLAPMGIGMMLINPFMGLMIDRFGIRRVSSGGACLTLLATLPMIYLALHGLNLLILIAALLLRGMGISSIGLPSLTAAYASISREQMPMATTSLNIVQRLGGPTLTTLCATFLAWKLGTAGTDHAVSIAFAWTFLILCAVHALTVLGAIRLPRQLNELATTD